MPGETEKRTKYNTHQHNIKAQIILIVFCADFLIPAMILETLTVNNSPKMLCSRVADWTYTRTPAVEKSGLALNHLR